MQNSAFSVRTVTEADHALLHRLAEACPPLDVHTPYTYWVLCTRFPETCFVLLHDGEPAGFLTAVRSARELFIWQIGLLPAWRGQGLSQLLIHSAVSAARQGEAIRVTIAPDNLASLGAFQGYCRKHGLSWTEEKQFDPNLCPDKENTYRMGEKSRP